MSHDEMESLVAGYVLLALDAEDREALEAHLATCELCARSVAEWQQVAGSLPLLVEQREPPQGLQGRILSAVRVQGAMSRDSPDQTDFPEHGTLGDKSNYKVVPRTRHCPLTHSNSPLS